MKKVLMIGPARSVKGGMTTVVEQYLNSSLKDEFDIEYIESTNDKWFLSKIIKMINGMIKFYFQIKKADIVHIHMASNMSTYRKLKYVKIAKKYKKRVILHIHGGGFKKFYDECSKKQQNYIRESINCSDKVIVLSNEWYQFFSNIINKEKIEIIYNGVALPEKYNKDLSNRNILFLGRINKQKGIYDLISVIKKLKKRYNDVCLYIGGSGEEEKIKMYVKNNDLEDNVKLLGWINEQEKNEILKKCTFFALPSYFEAMPMSILEAMSYQCVVIASDVGGIPQIINSENTGFLVKPGDCDKMYNIFCQLFEDEMLVKKVSSEARITIEKNFDIQNNIDKIKKIYIGD